MGQKFKLAGLVGVFKFFGLAGACALALAATPASAGGHFAGRGFGGHMVGAHVGGPGAGIAARPVQLNVGIHPGFQANGNFHRGGYDSGYRRGYGPGFYGTYGRAGYDYGYALPRAAYAGGYYGGGYAPAGDYSYYSAPAAADVAGADYPPYPVGYDGGSYAPTGNGVIYNVPAHVCCAAKIIYISGGHAQRETSYRSSQQIIVRGAASVD